MTTQNYYTHVNGTITWAQAVTVSTGASDAKKLVALDENGTLDPSVIPDSVVSGGGENSTDSDTAFTALTYGTTTIWNTAGKLVSKRTLVLEGNTTLSVTNSVNGQSGILWLTATANGVITLPSGGYRQLGTTLSMASGDVKILSFIYIGGTNYAWTEGTFLSV